jgi:hypothetical protein
MDRADYLVTLARLSVLDWLAPMPETPTHRAIREEGERLRKAFPQIPSGSTQTWTEKGPLKPWASKVYGSPGTSFALTVSAP